MKPEQFIREFGVEKAREVVEGAPSSATTARPSLDFKHYLYGRCENAGGSHILLSDLKRLVESVDLVNSLGGLKAARSEAHKDCFVYNQPLLAAIADYESIYGGGDE
ncbi:hypothetical protein [Acinetobacter baumannii]|uniref:hypothetical protein n=1 Tax=Acinetobacter baumannii TaxID=470 RepID=UPI0022EA4D45|nr:hypothetical protein [Acinetobacter baumannii]MDA3498421.1 hypothetical protein [Acinetobacter baumannii]